MNVAGQILRHGKTRPDSDALVDGTRTLTYRDLRDLTLRVGTALGSFGVRAGDRVGLLLKDTAEHLIALLAVARIGAVSAPLDWRARPAENVRLIKAAGVKLTLVEAGSQPIDDCSRLELGEEWWAAAALAPPIPDPPTDFDASFVISASSGSTGAPKLTAMSHRQYHFAMAGMLEVMDLAGRHRYLSSLPLYYSGGRNSCLAHLIRGDCVILHPSIFDAAEYLDFARRDHATVGVLVPSMIRRLLNESVAQSPSLPGFTTLFSTGAPLFADEKARALHQLTPNFQERFGAAESLVLSVLRAADMATRSDSVGQPHSFVEVEVVDDFDRPLQTGEPGRLRYRGPGVATPLLGSGAESSFLNGWFYPGEIARLDDLNFLYLEGRSSEVIFRGGAKVFPLEVEQVLLTHPAVIEAAVIGRPTADNEEEVVAFVVLRGDPTLGELIAHCRVRLAPHKTPRHYHIVSQLPRNTGGKVDKPALARSLDRAE